MNEFNQYNNLAIMAAIQEFYEQRAATKAAREARSRETKAPVAFVPANPSRLAAAITTVRKIATSPLPLPWHRAAA